MAQIMEDRTVNIILLSKKFGEPENVKKAIAKYMSEECLFPVEMYNENIILGVLHNAVYDFLHCATRSSDIIAFVRELMDCRFEKMIDKIIVALAMMQIREKYEWGYREINGWHETDFTKNLDADKWNLK